MRECWNHKKMQSFAKELCGFCTTRNFIKVIKIKTRWEGGVSLVNLPSKTTNAYSILVSCTLACCVVLYRIPAFTVNLLVSYLRWTSIHKTTIWRHSAVKALNLTTEMRSEILKGRHHLRNRHRADLKRHRSKGLDLTQVACDRNK
jgi:hypothetical protein